MKILDQIKFLFVKLINIKVLKNVQILQNSFDKTRQIIFPHLDGIKRTIKKIDK